MVFVIVVRFLTAVAIVVVGKKPRHLGDDVIVMIVVHRQVNLIVFLWVGVDDFIAVLFRHDIDLIIGKVRLELFGLVKSTRTEKHAGVLVEFLSQMRLH